MMAVEKRKHKNKVLNESIFNELINDAEIKKKQMISENSDSAINSRAGIDIEKQENVETEPNQPVLTLNRVVEEYHKALFMHTEAISFLEGSGIKNIRTYSAYQIGFCIGNLIERLGKNQVEEFKKTGLINDSNAETLKDCLTIPVFDENKGLISLYGLNIETGVFIKPIYFADKIPIFNEKASRVYDEIILTDNILSCLSLIDLGINNAIAINDISNLTADHIKTLSDNRVKTIIISIKDEFAADSLKDIFLGEGFKVKVVKKELIKLESKEEIKELVDKAETFHPESSPVKFRAFKEAYGYIFAIGEITYRVTGIKDIFYSNSLKVSIRAECNGESFPDTVDLYASRSREAFSAKLSSRFGLEAKRIEKDLLMILDHLEAEQLAKYNIKGIEEERSLTEAERELGMEFLKSPDIIKQIIGDIENLGFVGEDNNKLLMYLCAVSRKLDDPISVIIISQSGAGKSHLVNTIKKLVPEEDVKNANSASELAFYYSDDLLGKFIIMGEAVHSEKIEHQIREMISEKELVRYVVLKDEKTGEMKSVEKRVKVNASLVITTTRNDINDENLSRCFIIHTDESKEQTKRILEYQKERFSLESHYRKKDIVPEIIAKHHAAQRLLTNRVIVNPFRKHLAFLEENMRRRRDFYRFQVLIASCAFLRQMQKEEYEDKRGLKYIRCDMIDYETAYDLGKEIFTGNLEGIPNGAIMLYDEIRNMVHEVARMNNLKALEITFTQRDIRKKVKTGADSVRKYIAVLVRYEYLAVASGKAKGTRFSYRLVTDEAMERIDFSKVPTPEEIAGIMRNDNYED